MVTLEIFPESRVHDESRSSDELIHLLETFDALRTFVAVGRAKRQRNCLSDV